MFAILLLVCLTIPGWSILRLVAKKTDANQVWLFFPIMSLSYFLALYLFYNVVGLSYQSFSITYFVLLGVLLLANLVQIKIKVSDLSVTSVLQRKVLPVVMLFGGLFVYALWAGPYVEIPGDPLWHMGRLTDAIQAWRDDTFITINSLSYTFSPSNYYWYKFCGWLVYLSGSSLQDQLHTLWVVNLILFTAAFYAFAKVIFRDSQLSEQQIVWASVLAVLLMVLHYGIGPFSYVRYYVFAPGYFAMTGYWAVLVIVWRYLTGLYSLVYSAIFVCLLTLTVSLLHHQEVVYIIVMSAAIIVLSFIRSVTSKGFNKKKLLHRVNICFALLVVAYVSLHVFLYLTKVRNYPLNGGWVISLNELLPFVNHLYVLKPTGQFYQVLTIFGVWAYGVYFFYAKKLKLPTIIVAGLWVPLFTVFNPVFVDLFLRLTYPEVLWRICFIIPFSLFMAYMLVYWSSCLLNHSNKLVAIRMTILILVTLVFLLPFNAGFVFNNYDKFSMLKPVSEKADHRQINDVLTFLNEQPAQKVLTDQVTGYVVNALTKHQYLGDKFYGSGTLNTNRQEVKIDYFSDYNNGMLVLNYRQGIDSDIGRTSGHWKTNTRNYQTYYGKAFIDFINNHPESFKPMKQFDGVQIFEIDLSN